MKRLLLPGLASLLLLAACARGTVTRDEWLRMPHGDRVMYVRSLVGSEKVKNAKGGHGRSYVRPVEEYVAQIDRAYGKGDQRPVHEIFREFPR
jgi:hypothetical protein